MKDLSDTSEALAKAAEDWPPLDGCRRPISVVARFVHGPTPLAIVQTCVLSVFPTSEFSCCANHFATLEAVSMTNCAGWPTHPTAKGPIVYPIVSLVMSRRFLVEGAIR